jgi:hypothetical protein
LDVILLYRHQQELPRGPTGQAHHTQGSTKISNKKYQKYQTKKADDGTLARNLSTGLRRCYIFNLQNFF